MVTLIVLVGIGQLVLVAASLAIPCVLQWSAETAKLRPLTRQVFWTYAGYIWTTNLCFGLVSTLAPTWLLDRSPLAGAVASFITLYWGARLVIQFAYFDRTDVPPGMPTRLAEAALVGLFLYLTLVYGSAALFNFGGTAG
ncbi:MAG: hypothetical protein K2R98_32365 [Gemmataceae bacterium]|nr:hypothetical protein [Gemmataceae bacterium]